ncbi:High mobility group superfamily [Penicillium capsulatum]|uniref:High mobility group superfamily n=1 Tax=Penicillium capsulatum TaxID=69766 RepID=A0A9W9IBI7_9EURO|nr:High mobility group superfamily [Penicillium capsulatum]KAJ6135885.1 High mobility group superfamily [Penicillium capsulatum]
MTARSSQARERDPKQPPKPIRIDQVDTQSRYRQPDERNDLLPEMKRRRVSHTSYMSDKPSPGGRGDRSPGSPYSTTPYSARPDMQQRNVLPMVQPPRPHGGPQAHPDPSLKLPPLQTGTPATTPLTPFSQDGSSVEATVMTIPFLNKIKLLAKISPPLVPSFCESHPPVRGPVIAVDGQDPELVRVAVEFLDRLLKKESKYNVRIFDGPDIQAPRGSSEAGHTGDATVDYLDTISAWHRISDEVKGFVRSSSAANSVGSRASPDEESAGDLSPKTIIPRTANLQIHSPAQSSENGSEGSVLSCSPSTLPIALVPRYQLTTADAFACSIPISDSYGPLDHWQWMASLWRACVGPDITVYIRECSREELDRVGGNPVEVRLQDARTIVLRKVNGTSRELEERSLKRVGFEIEDFLAQ